MTPESGSSRTEAAVEAVRCVVVDERGGPVRPARGVLATTRIFTPEEAHRWIATQYPSQAALDEGDPDRWLKVRPLA